MNHSLAPALASFRRFYLQLTFCLTIFVYLFAGAIAKADDGYRLWLRYDPLPAQNAKAYQARVTTLVAPGNAATQVVIRQELLSGCSGLLGRTPATANAVTSDGALVVGTPQNNSVIAGLKLNKPLADLGPEGFLIRSVKIGARSATVIASQSEVGALYGAFHFLRLLQTLQPIGALNVSEKPRLKLRVLDHWDNINGSVERGYAGRSLWNWKALPEKVDTRLRDYARANASLGINGAVLNNVNASVQSLNPDYLRKTAAIADALRPYGVRVYLSARFSAPIELGGLQTADPLAPEVVAWWKAKADEIYQLIPDFGGFLVKANSEGQPGPLTYKRTHADGANMLAAALAPHNGVVMWRAFVYAPAPNSDRVGQAYDEFKPLDGQFASNVLLQVKNGPLDFMPREPFHPLFGAMPRTQLMPEVQITQEYLGHANHVAFLAPMWREFLASDTYAKGAGSTVAKVVDGSLGGQKLTGIAGVANAGSERNWTGHDLAQANWYAFGRLAWNPNLSSQQIANEWSEMTWTHNPQAVQSITRILLESREAVVSYMMPLGLAHIMDFSHYGPQPWREAAAYFHQADAQGLGFDRTATGSDAVSQYQGDARAQFADLARCPDEYLLWFHHVSWDYQMRSGRTMWDELCLHYQSGVNWTRKARTDWDALAGTIDPQRHAAVAARLAIQERDAIWWRDACLLYFQSFSKRPFPAGVEKPQQTLEEVKKLQLPESVAPAPAVASLLKNARGQAINNQAMNSRGAEVPLETQTVAPLAPAAAAVPADKENFHIYLLMGQSNMVGRDTRTLAADSQESNPRVLALNSEGQWVIAKNPLHEDSKIAPGVGPAMSFALEMAKADPSITIGLVPCAVGNTPLSRWSKGADLYEKALSRAQIAAQSGVIKGVLWHQGEAETEKKENAETYEARLSQMFGDLRGDLESPNLPIVVGQLGEFFTAEKHPYVETVRSAIKQVSTVVPNVGYAGSEGLGDRGDKVHFSAEAQKTFGMRYAQAMQNLQ